MLITYGLYVFATRIPEFTAHAAEAYALGPQATNAVRVSLWIFYWFWQSITFIGIWCLGHETGHDGLSQYRFVNNLIGTVLHTFLLVPYFSWRRTHSNHHVRRFVSSHNHSSPYSSPISTIQKTTNDMARDETYHPPTRSEMKLPNGKVAVEMDYKEILEETPAFTLFKMFIRQFWYVLLLLSLSMLVIYG
jgi:fatty acid desaturase